MEMRKEEIKLSLCADDRIVYVENSREAIRNFLEKASLTRSYDTG